MKKYREKLTQNPQKYEEVKRNHAERAKNKSKKYRSSVKKRKKTKEMESLFFYNIKFLFFVV